jgi:hypothetical protein
MVSGSIEFSCVAKASERPDLVNGISGAFCFHRPISGGLGSHLLRSNRALRSKHFVLDNKSAIDTYEANLKQNNTPVKVPVLSEQITDTAPNVSTVLSDLHNTWLRLIIFAVIVSEAVSAMRRPSGTKATATVTMSMISPAMLIQFG